MDKKFYMQHLRFSFLIMLLLIFITNKSCVAQANEEDESTPTEISIKGFQAGIVLGTYFANKFTSNLYNGYGYTFEGTKNDFANSWMYRKIVVEYGGGNGQPDRIAQSLNVNSNEWSFSENDMPFNLKYNVAFLIGANTRYCFNSNDAIIFNVNAAKLTVNGNFTITLLNPPIGTTTPGYTNFKTFSIRGTEQRLLFQLGYQRISAGDGQLNAFIEGGATVSMAKFEKNEILINALQIDITTQYNPVGYITYRAKNLTGVGIGAFAGVGLNLNATAKWTLQLLYSPSFDHINIGADSKHTLQHAAGIRGYYNL